MKDLQDYLISYFGISHENIEAVTALYTESEIEKGDYFLKSGQYCERLSFVQNGYLLVFAHAKDKEVTQWIAAQGYFLTDLNSFIFGQRARWTVQALTPCTLYTIHKREYSKLHTILPDWPEIEKRFIASCFVTLEDRIFSHLSANAEERYDQLFERDSGLFNQVPLQYLASMLGMSPETFSRIRKKRVS